MLILVHGAVCDASVFDPIIAALPQAVALNLRHHAPERWQRGEEYSAALHAAQLAAFIAAQPAPVDLLGHSRGGDIALRVALALPGRIRRLVLIEPVPQLDRGAMPAPPPKPGIGPAIRAAAALLQQGHTEDALAAFMAAVDRPRGWEEIPPPMRRMLLRNATTLAALQDEPRDPLTAAQLASLGLPVLLLAGGDSPAFFHHMLAATAAALPEARSATIAAAGHFTFTDQPAACIAAIEGFLG